MNRQLLKHSLWLSVVLLTASLSYAEAMKSYRLELSGNPDIRIDGYCDVSSGGIEHRQVLRGELPQHHHWQGESINCRIEQTDGGGALQAVLESDGNRSRFRTGGEGSRIRFRLN